MSDHNTKTEEEVIGKYDPLEGESIEDWAKRHGVDSEGEYEELDPRASEAEKQLFHAKTATLVEVGSEEHGVVLKITPEGAFLNGKFVEGHEFLEAWKAAWAVAHEIMTNRRDAESAARGPNFEGLMRRYISQFSEIYNVTGLEHEDTEFMKKADLTTMEREALLNIGQQYNYKKKLKELEEREAKLDAGEYSPPSLMDRLINRFKRA